MIKLSLIPKAVFIFLIFSCLLCQNTGASIFPPNCVCEVKARVLEINETPVRKDAFITENLISVSMKIEIIKVEKMVKPGISKTMNCDVYNAGKMIEVRAIRPRDFIGNNQVINTGSIIRAYIEYSGDENGQWYNFDHIETIKE